MDTLKQSGMKPTNNEKHKQMEPESIKTTTSGLSKELEHKETSSNETICKSIKDTPYMAVAVPNQKVFLAIGKYRTEARWETLEEAEKYATIPNWENITFILSVMKSELTEYINSFKINK